MGHLGFTGCGGTIPLLEMLQQMFPSASLLCTGVVGPDSNMHGPNEMLHVGYTKKFTACISLILGIIDIQETRDWGASAAYPEGVPCPDGATEAAYRARSPSSASAGSSPLGSPRGLRSPRLSPKFH